MAGPENVIGANVFFGQRVSDCDVVVQIGNPLAHVMDVRAFNSEMEQRGAFYNHVIRSNQALTSEIIRTAACNSLHPVEQRCCRWLLTAHDHADGDEFPLTHDILASLLGVRRPTVTITLMELQRAGLIRQRRGVMVIVNRDGLRERVCECHTSINRSIKRLLPEIRDFHHAEQAERDPLVRHV